jgi:hypothetical protein
MADTKSIVPKITPQEALRAAEALASRAKQRFLEGAVEEAADLAMHASKLCSTLDAEASGLLASLARSFAAYAYPPSSGATGSAVAKPAAAAPAVPPPIAAPPAAPVPPPAAE